MRFPRDRLKTNRGVQNDTRLQSHYERSSCPEYFDKLSNCLSKGSNLNATEDEIATRLRRLQLWDCFVTRVPRNGIRAKLITKGLSFVTLL
jgi:hypothetical protein